MLPASQHWSLLAAEDMGALRISCRVASASGCDVVREAFVLSDSCFVRFGNRYTSKGWETKGFDRDADLDNFL